MRSSRCLQMLPPAFARRSRSRSLGRMGRVQVPLEPHSLRASVGSHQSILPRKLENTSSERRFRQGLVESSTIGATGGIPGNAPKIDRFHFVEWTVPRKARRHFGASEAASLMEL